MSYLHAAKDIFSYNEAIKAKDGKAKAQRVNSGAF